MLPAWRSHFENHCSRSLLLFSFSVMSNSLQPMDYSTPGFPVLHHVPEHDQTHIRRVGDAIQPSHPLSPPSPAFSLCQHQGLFQWVGSLHQVVKYWNFSLSISPSNEYSGLISFRIDWFDLLAVQGTHKRVFSSPRIQKYQFFGAQSSLWSNIWHDYWKTIGLIIWAFVSKVMSSFLMCCPGLS